MKIIILLSAAILISACSGSTPEVSQEPVANTNEQSKRVSETVLSHGASEEKPKMPVNADSSESSAGGEKKKWSRSGDAIDTSKFDASIAEAQKALKSKNDDASKKALGTAYFERGVALTAARQYASAIGDFRKAIKNDSANEDAKRQLAMIMSIYDSMKIESPAEGEEPPPLEFGKQKD